MTARSQFHNLKINENSQNLVIITKRTSSNRAELLITFQESPCDGLCLSRQAHLNLWQYLWEKNCCGSGSALRQGGILQRPHLSVLLISRRKE